MREDYRKLLSQYQEMRREIKTLKENEELRFHLALHDNANTPPSRKMAKRRKKTDAPKDDSDTSEETPPKRRGTQSGHKGKTSKPTTAESRTHAPVRCPECGNTSLDEESSEVVDITEIPQPVRATTIRHILITCKCGDCGLDEIRPNVDLPKRGSYGKNVVTTVIHNFLDCLPAG